MININEIENILIGLWRGNGANIDELTSFVNNNVQMILDSVPALRKVGVDFPIEYIKVAMKNMSVAIENADDYMLADNIYYEWREIFNVFNETLAEYGE